MTILNRPVVRMGLLVLLFLFFAIGSTALAAEQDGSDVHGRSLPTTQWGNYV